MNLIVRKERVWGNDLVYPICDKAKKLCSITPHKTFSPFAIQRLKELGYKFILHGFINRIISNIFYMLYDLRYY